jgi:hypothetical protein
VQEIPSIRAVRAPKTQRTCILVLGMHRSGTSALTRVLNLLGCDLPNTLMPAGPHNETGHWESNTIYKFNNRILESSGSAWHDWTELNPGWFQSPKADEFRDEALKILESEFGSSHLFALKDPRICRLFPFWRDILEQSGVQPLVISPVRNPLEVAASLQKRDGFEPSLGHLVWLRHVLDAEAASRGTLRFFTSYDRMLNGWGRFAEDVQSALGINWPRLSERTFGEIDAFLSDNLRHHHEARENVIDNPSLSKWLRSSFRVLNEWAESGEKEENYATLDRIRQELNVAAPAFGRLVAVGQKAGEKARKLEHSLSEAETAATTLRDQLSETQSSLQQRWIEAEETATELSNVRKELREAAVARAESEKITSDLKEQVAQLLTDAEMQAKESFREIEELTHMVLKKETDFSALESSSAQDRKERDELTEKVKTQAAELERTRATAEMQAQERFREIEELTRMLLKKETDFSVRDRDTILKMIELRPPWTLLPAQYRLKRQITLLRKCRLFDPSWYVRHYEDIRESGVDPLRHYIEFGAMEGRLPYSPISGSE